MQSNFSLIARPPCAAAAQSNPYLQYLQEDSGGLMWPCGYGPRQHASKRSRMGSKQCDSWRSQNGRDRP